MRSSLRDHAAGVTFVVATVALLIPATVQACAVCVGSSPADHGYFWAILFLMSMPFALGGSIGGWLLYTYWRAPGGGPTTVPTLGRESLSQRASPFPAVRGRDDGHLMSDGQTNGTNPRVWTQTQKESAN